ncbi:hypothetical protein NIES2100_18870 [Calothrix sp. NIES-2100]|nr:hypothetical protein NIES2100_18870 [Calothrix sp. NIES-2100]
MFIGVNLSQTLIPQAFYPTPQSPPRLRGGEVLRQQNWGGVTRIWIVARKSKIISWQGFHVKLTRMNIVVPLPGYHILCSN